VGILDWFDERASDVANLSSGAWVAMAAWLAVAIAIGALVYAWRQAQQTKQEQEDLSQPNVAMFMEPSASDWHLVELVIKNYGQRPAYGIKFEFASPPTVPRYESAEDRFVDIVPLKLPAEIPYLAPSQEWRTVWDSALDRKQLGESIGSRFAGAVTFYDQPNTNRQGTKKQKSTRKQFRTPAVLDWSTLHPVERLELLTTHDLARQEKQKLELLRGLLTYFHYASTESRQEVLQVEINKINAAAAEQRERYRSQYAVAENTQHAPYDDERYAQQQYDQQQMQQYGEQQLQQYGGQQQSQHPPQYPDERRFNNNDDDAETRVINGRHRQRHS
jgi:hypothetical protein